ncbi:nucleotidyl transferase AbiEii/AbiGii toxin family protein [Actinophytocola sediminis]
MSTTPHLGSVRLPPLANNRDEVLWPVLMDLAAELPKPWTVIGGQMVYLHGLVVGRAPHRYTEDIDLVFDITLNVRVIEKAHAALGRLGFEVKDVSAEGLAHRYVNSQRVEVDILAPDNVGERAATRLSTPAGRTVQVPGGRKALQNTCSVEANYADRTAPLFIPDLLTAVDIKLKAMNLPGRTDAGRSRHLDDIAFLLSLSDDPDELLESPATSRLRLTPATALDDASHPSWRLLGQHGEDGFAVWEMLRTR